MCWKTQRDLCFSSTPVSKQLGLIDLGNEYFIIIQPTTKARLRAHRAKCINVCLGAFGSPSRKCATRRANSFNLRSTNPGSQNRSRPSQVTLWGTAPFLGELYEQLTGARRTEYCVASILLLYQLPLIPVTGGFRVELVWV